MRWRVAGVLIRPRGTLADVAASPRWATLWVAILAIWAVCGAWLLSTPVGRQALVDERVRVVEAFGGTVSDADYAALQASPPWSAYFTSGGRLALAPPVTLAVAGVLWLLGRPHPSMAQALAIAVHASVVLVLGQIVATPLHYVRESLTSPLNLASILPLLDEGTLPARLLGAVDVFTIWWIALVAIGGAVLSGRTARRLLLQGVGVYVGIAAMLAIAQAFAGGS